MRKNKEEFCEVCSKEGLLEGSYFIGKVKDAKCVIASKSKWVFGIKFVVFLFD